MIPELLFGVAVTNLCWLDDDRLLISLAIFAEVSRERSVIS